MSKSGQLYYSEMEERDELIQELVEALKDILENCNFEKKDYASKRNINEFRANAKALIAKVEGK